MVPARSEVLGGSLLLALHQYAQFCYEHASTDPCQIGSNQILVDIQDGRLTG